MADRGRRGLRRPAAHAAARRSRLPTALPSDADLADPGPARSQAYDRAWLFALFVANTRGAPTLRALYVAACGARHTDLPTAVRDVLGTDDAGILADWQRWLARQPTR